MAPESERAKGFCGKQMTRWNPGTGAMFCNSAPGHEGSCSYTYFFRDDSPPKEPTLTCSEVVERLLMSANDFKDQYEWTEPHDVTYHAPRAAYSHDELIEFAEAYATAILHSWRERRVQELEMLIARAAFFVSFTKAEFNKRGDFDGIYKANCWSQDAEKLLNSEWREQIRKGAKHDASS